MAEAPVPSQDSRSVIAEQPDEEDAMIVISADEVLQDQNKDEPWKNFEFFQQERPLNQFMEKGSSPTKRLIEMKNSQWAHTKAMKDL